MVARGLPADPDRGPVVVRHLDELGDEPRDRLVPLVEPLGELLRIAVDAQHELGQGSLLPIENPSGVAEEIRG